MLVLRILCPADFQSRFFCKGVHSPGFHEHDLGEGHLLAMRLVSLSLWSLPFLAVSQTAGTHTESTSACTLPLVCSKSSGLLPFSGFQLLPFFHKEPFSPPQICLNNGPGFPLARTSPLGQEQGDLSERVVMTKEPWHFQADPPGGLTQGPLPAKTGPVNCYES